MSRRIRHSLPGAIYHVMMRGNNGQSIFSSNDERSQFCLLMQEGIERYGHRVLAFCFMTNHVHLAIQLGDVSFSKICQNLSFRYTRFYNRRHGVVGHLFQGRFKSILVSGEVYLKKLIRYIHLNPVRAKLISDPADYLWSSHQFYLGHKECGWLSKNLILQLFGKSYDEALEQYCKFIVEGIGQDEEVDFKKGVTSGIIAEDEFIERLEVKCINHNLWMDSNRGGLERLIKVIAESYNIDVKEAAFLCGYQKDSKMRSILAYLARYIKGITIKEVAIFCNCAERSISRATTNLGIQIKESEILRKEIEFLKDKLISEMKNPNVLN